MKRFTLLCPHCLSYPVFEQESSPIWELFFHFSFYFLDLVPACACCCDDVIIAEFRVEQLEKYMLRQRVRDLFILSSFHGSNQVEAPKISLPFGFHRTTCIHAFTNDYRCSSPGPGWPCLQLQGRMHCTTRCQWFQPNLHKILFQETYSSHGAS